MSYYLEEPSSYLIEQGYDLQPSYCIRRGWEIVVKNIGPYIGFFMLIILISIFGNVVPVIGGLAVMAVSPVLNAGFYLVARKISQDEPFEFADFFKGFEDFAQLFLVSLVSGLLILVGLIFLIIPGIYLAVSYTLAPMLVVFGKMEFWDALETSRKVVTKNWWSFFGLFLLIILINLAGLLAFGVGLLISIPVSYVALYVAFEEIYNLGQGERPLEDHFII